MMQHLQEDKIWHLLENIFVM